jgi:YbbR domain-containing protein
MARESSGVNSSFQEQIINALTSNLGTKLISVVIAIVLWMIVLGSRNVEATKEIPLEVVTPSDVIPSNDIPDRIAFRLSGPKAFLRTVLDRKEDPIRVNLTGAKPGLVTYRFFSDNIRVPIGVKVLTINPTAVLIKLEAQKRREVPVKVELRGAVPDGYRVAKTEVRPPTVRLKGAETRVDAVNEALTMPVDISNLKHSIEKEVALDLTRYSVQLDGPTPKVFVDIEPVSANYRIKNVDIRVLSSYKVKLEEKTVSVLVRADPKDLKALTPGKIYGVVDLKSQPKGEYNESVKVTLPDGVGLVKVIPEKVNITLY